MAKILNLDKLAASLPKRELVIDGKTHVVADMTVDNFVKTTRDAQRLIKEQASLADQVEATVEMIVRGVPTLKREDLAGMPLDSLKEIASFVRGDSDGDDEEPQPAAEGEAGKE